MVRFAGVKKSNIYIISDEMFTCPNYLTLEIPTNLDNISSTDIITNYQIKDARFVSKHDKKSSTNLKVAFVGNWKMRCGIATYSENLWPEVAKRVSDFKLFIEKHDKLTGPFNVLGDQIIPDEKVLPCWTRGESLQELIIALKTYDPDIIWIQHEFGLWPNARYWLSMMNQLSDYRVIVTMHSVFHHKDKTICEAAIPEIVVHLDGAVKLLKEEKEISGKVYMIPHGCYHYDNEKLWNFYKSEQTFVQFGFLFRYKGWQNAIEATAILKEKYPNIFFTGLCSESDYSKVEHQLYYNELMSLIDKLKLQENVSLIRGYQSDKVLDSFLKTNKVAVFPYVSTPQHEVFGASGAARFAMAKGLPVITSTVNHFSDLPTMKADNPEDLAGHLDTLFSDYKVRGAQIAKQLDYVNENTWAKVAMRYIDLFEKGF